MKPCGVTGLHRYNLPRLSFLATGGGRDSVSARLEATGFGVHRFIVVLRRTGLSSSERCGAPQSRWLQQRAIYARSSFDLAAISCRAWLSRRRLNAIPWGDLRSTSGGNIARTQTTERHSEVQLRHPSTSGRRRLPCSIVRGRFVRQRRPFCGRRGILGWFGGENILVSTPKAKLPVNSADSLEPAVSAAAGNPLRRFAAFVARRSRIGRNVTIPWQSP